MNQIVRVGRLVLEMLPMVSVVAIGVRRFHILHAIPAVLLEMALSLRPNVWIGPVPERIRGGSSRHWFSRPRFIRIWARSADTGRGFYTSPPPALSSV